MAIRHAKSGDSLDRLLLGRSRLARTALPEHRPWFRRYGWTFTCLAPLGTVLWLCGHFASAGANTIDWRGTRYQLK